MGSLTAALALAVRGLHNGRTSAVAILAAYQLHLARRVWECSFVHRFSGSARMPLHLFLAGVAHYVAVPLTLLPPKCVAPSLLLLRRSDHARLFADGGVDWIGPCGVGLLLAIVAWANLQQHRMHVYLAALRPVSTVEEGSAAASAATIATIDSGDLADRVGAMRRRKSKRSAPVVSEFGTSPLPLSVLPHVGRSSPGSAPPASTYALPSSGPFDYVMCPHYTYEVIIYACLAAAVVLEGAMENHSDHVALGGITDSLASTVARWAALLSPVLMVVWVASNLYVTAAHTKCWYETLAQEGTDGMTRLSRRPLWPRDPWVLLTVPRCPSDPINNALKKQ